MVMQPAAGAFGSLLAAGRAAWPALAVDDSRFSAHIERHLAGASDREAALGRIRPDDLYLACACSSGDGAAITSFERHFAKVIDRALSRFAKTEDRKTELRQLLRERLFVAAPGAEPRIASYTGQGFLENWLRVAATRAFVNAERGKKVSSSSDDETLAALAGSGDVELDFLKVHYRAAFRAAFARTIEALDPSDRLVLRLSVLKNMSCDDLAVTLGVHRATAARRVARAKQMLVDGTRQELAESLRVDSAELHSILNLVESNLDLSISRLLGPPDTSESSTTARARGQ